MTYRRLALIADFVESQGCVAIVRPNRVEFSLVYISDTTGELVEEVMSAETLEDARVALGCR